METTTTSHAEEIRAHAERCAEGRKTWGDGPWSTEPDRIEWRSEHGVHAIMLRQPASGHWCGYVGVEPGHPWHGLDMSALWDLAPEQYPSCHFGVTYAEACVGAVCRVPAPGEPERLWWVGFDCAHCDDATPRDIAQGYTPFPGQVYRTESWVRAEVEQLAAQAARIASDDRAVMRALQEG